jgi:20S proteasome subunit beta 1
VWGYVDENYRPNMSKHEIKDFIKRTIGLAIYRDSSSGGIIRLLDITKDKVEREYIPYPEFHIK